MPYKRFFSLPNMPTLADSTTVKPCALFFYCSRMFFVLPIWFYRLCISPLLPNVCKYQPSCSAYAIEAIMCHGIFKGFLLSCWRILRCNPWTDGGLDPVPPKSLRG